MQQTTKSIETLQVARVDELHYAVVWSEGPTLWLRYLLTDSGEPSGAAIELSNSFPPDATPPALAAGPKGLLVAWHVDDGKEGDIHGVLVDGPTVGPSFPISAAPAAQRAPRAVFAGGRFLVVWIDARGKVPSVFGQLLDPNGAPVRSPVDQNLELAPTSGPVTATALTGCHGRFDVLFADARYGKSALFLQRVDGDGTLLGGNEGEVLYAGEDAVLGADVSCTADEPLATILVGPKLVALPFKP